MKNVLIRIVMLLIVTVSFTSCELVKGIFEAGMGFGIFIVVVVIGLVLFLISKMFGGGGTKG